MPDTPEEREHDGWRDMTDREMLSYAWTVLLKAEERLDHTDVVWAEVATAVGHLDRRLRREPHDA